MNIIPFTTAVRSSSNSNMMLANRSFGFLQRRLFRSADVVAVVDIAKHKSQCVRRPGIPHPYSRATCRSLGTTPRAFSSFEKNQPQSVQMEEKVPTTNFVSLSEVLRDQVSSGSLRSDKAQQRVAKRLSRLQQALIGYDNEILFRPPPPSPPVADDESSREETKNDHSEESKGTDDGVASAKDLSPPTPTPPPVPSLRIPRGLYIHGSVGTGKSMLMDAFFEHAPVQKKARYHFHSFLAQVHQQIHQLKQDDLKAKGRNFSIDTSTENNPIHRVGLQLSESMSVLCLDEFQVTDIADAVILSQLFSVLFHKGTVVVATSNRPPQDLYEGGLNRSYFLPFLDLLEKHCIVHAIQSDVDYRRTLASCSSFFGSDEEMQPVLEEVLETVVGVADMNDDVRAVDLPVGFQRTLQIDRTYETSNSIDPSSSSSSSSSSRPLRLCRLDFSQVCDADLGALDYRSIARYFDVVCLEHVPVMDLEGHNRARRFITLIDELYEAKCCLLLSTADTDDDVTEPRTPLDLFHVPHSDTTSSSKNNNDPGEVSLGVDVATQGGLAVGALASVRELAFAFERASSRIIEMCSRSWWEKQLSSPRNVGHNL